MRKTNSSTMKILLNYSVRLDAFHAIQARDGAPSILLREVQLKSII